MENSEKSKNTNNSTHDANRSLFSFLFKKSPTKQRENKEDNLNDIDDESNEDKSLWVPDNQAESCFNCGKKFMSLLNRRHHCRLCGNVFCKGCTTKLFDVAVGDQIKELKTCEHCKNMYIHLNSIISKSVNEHIDDQGNKIYQTKLNDYVKSQKNKNNKIKMDIGDNDRESQDLNEIYNTKLEELYLLFVKEVIKKVLTSSKNFPNLYEKWGELITQLTIKAINAVSPSFQDLGDSIDINEFIKIKGILYHDHSLSRVIDGYAFQKNVCTKRMRTMIDNPKILILNCGLEAKRDNKIQMPNILTIEPAYLNILKKKIESVKPQVILVSKSANHRLQEDFSTKELNISVVTNVKLKSLEKIARCTKTLVLPSADLIGKQIILGECKQFKVEKIPINNKSNTTKEGLFIKSNEYNLMVFEGCDELLHCTIILSGQDKLELKELKNLMKNSILLTVRDLYLQKYLHKFFNVDIFQTYDSSQYDKNIKEAKEISHFSYGFDHQIMSTLKDNESNINLELIQLFMNNRKSNHFFDSNNSNAINRSFSITSKYPKERSSNSFKGEYTSSHFNTSQISLKDIPTKESEIIKSASTFCEVPLDVIMRFYSSDTTEEKPLGKLIIDLCNQKEEKCHVCKQPNLNHSYYLYSGDGRIKISMLKNKEDFVDEMMNYIERENCLNPNNNQNKDLLEIYSYGYCEVDGLIVTPLIKLPKEIFNFSASRYYKHILFNHSIKNLNRKGNYNIKKIFSCECEHFLYKNISRVFMTKIGNIKFSYEPIIRYEFIDSKENKDSKEILCLLNKKALENVLIIFEETTMEVLKKIKQRLQGQLSHLSKLNNQLLNDCIEKVKENTKVCFDIVEEITKIIGLFKVDKFDNILRANVSIKNLYLKIVQAKVMCNIISQIIRKFHIIIFIYEVREMHNKSKLSIVQQPEEEKDNNELNDNDQNEVQVEYIGVEKEKSDKNKQSSVNAQNNNNNGNQSGQKEIEQEINLDKIIEEQLKIKKENDELIFEEIYSLDKDNNYQRLLDFLFLYDNNHSKYSVDVNQDDICSIIAHLLTSDQYLSFINSGNKLNLNEINRKIKETPTPTDSALFKTSLLFNLESISFSYDKVEENKVRQQLETKLLSDEKTSLKVPFHFNLTKIINDTFTETKSKPDTINNMLKINYTDVLFQFRQCKEKFEKIKQEIKNIHNTNFVDIKSKFKFTKLKFIEDSKIPIEGSIIAYYPKQFEAMRILYCTSYEDFVLSIEKSLEWRNVSGGKSKANFYKSSDNKFVIKYIAKQEFKMFLESGFHYFHHTNKYLFHKMPSAMAKTLGAFKIKFKHPEKRKYYCIIMENLFYNVITKDSLYETFDLKGSSVNRYIKKQDQRVGRVLQDTNFMEKFKGLPLVLDKNLYTLFKSAIQNDCLILSKMTVIDYSLLLIISENPPNLFTAIERKNEENKHKENENINYIKMGIIDYFRKYTWDKQMEMLGKKLIHKNLPTIINPNDYKKRFIEKVTNYFIGV